jgi:hypothetical protein
MVLSLAVDGAEVGVWLESSVVLLRADYGENSISYPMSALGA